MSNKKLKTLRENLASKDIVGNFPLIFDLTFGKQAVKPDDRKLNIVKYKSVTNFNINYYKKISKIS